MKCPGQDMRYWGPDAVIETKCPTCGNSMEFFKDESTRKCKKCGRKVINPKMDFGCASYCPYASQCLGDLPPELLAQRKDLLKNRVAVEMKRYFKTDFKRIGHATKVARYAERIANKEGGGLAVVLCAAYLHDIGIKEAERKHNSTAARYQEEEGPPVAREMLVRLGADEELVSEVCDIVAHHHHPRDEETANFKAVYDSDMIVNMEERQEASPTDPQKLAAWIEKALLTPSGRELAGRILLRREEEPEKRKSAV